MDKDRMIEICLDDEFGSQWEGTEGQVFRTQVLGKLEEELVASITDRNRPALSDYADCIFRKNSANGNFHCKALKRAYCKSEPCNFYKSKERYMVFDNGEYSEVIEKENEQCRN